MYRDNFLEWKKRYIYVQQKSYQEVAAGGWWAFKAYKCHTSDQGSHPESKQKHFG